MGKNGKAIKKRKLAQAAQLTTRVSLLQDMHGDNDAPLEPSFLAGLVSPAELGNAVKTLQTLTTHPELLSHRQELRALRTAVFDFQRVGNEVSGTGNSLSSRISAALNQRRHLDALVLLSEFRLRQQKPKLGALQRWVRECDAASRSDGSFGDEMVLKVLDAILRCTAGEPVPEHEGTGLIKAKEGQVVVRQKDWVYREPDSHDLYKDIQEGRFPPQEDRARLASAFCLLQETCGPERLPPNLYPALLFTSRPSSITLSPTPPTPVTRVEAPHLPGAFLLTDVLSREEATNIIAHTEALGFKPDQPLGEEQASVLAHNVYWLADSDFISLFCARFLHLCPQVVDGGRVTGINARFRVYRYVPGAIYRPHVDGAWPKSGIDPATGQYVYDSAPKDKPQWSRLTFLIYLNDHFDNGCTTFFVPSSRHSTLNAFPVKPVAGCALVFPHGDSDSMLHEGSPVGEGGAKYVIRTEVLYETQPVGFELFAETRRDIAPEQAAKRLREKDAETHYKEGFKA
ncbi:hypothetical protein JCM11641_002120 [Rhodosporidiobolus odoratus]